MKPDWDKLAEEFKGSESIVIADVDCTDEAGEDVCKKYNVTGYPTLKSFYPGSDVFGESYEGGRDFDSLKEHATSGLVAVCGDGSEEPCSAEEKEMLGALKSMGWRGRTRLATRHADELSALEADYEVCS